MKNVVVASAIVSLAAAIETHKLVNDPEHLEHVMSNVKTWKASPSKRFEGMTFEEVKKLLGTTRDGPIHKASKSRLGKWDLQAKRVEDLPTNFDTRTNWPACADISGHVRDQASCGSCWAFGSTEAFNDRMCISHGLQILLSPADTAGCCNFFSGCLGSDGCNGGQPSDAWGYFVSNGVVSGGDYNSGSGSCYPYPIPGCSHHVDGPLPPCTGESNTINCPYQQGNQQCPQTGYAHTWLSDKHKAVSSYALSSVEAAMTDIQARGSITGAFDVYSDFLLYKSGVYQVSANATYLGGHAIKIVGWGTDSASGLPYWEVLNSWNDSWGDDGTFKILRGQDECGIEDDLVAGAV